MNVDDGLTCCVRFWLWFQDESTEHRDNSYTLFSFIETHRLTLGQYLIEFIRYNVCNEFFQRSCDLVGWPNLSTSCLESFHSCKCSKIEKGRPESTRSFFRFTNNPFPSWSSPLLGILLLGIVSTTWVEWVVLEWVSKVLNFVEWQPLSLVGVVRRSIVLLSQCLSRVSYSSCCRVNLILLIQNYDATRCTCRVLSGSVFCCRWTKFVQLGSSFSRQYDNELTSEHCQFHLTFLQS
jgi:hypothetical protein